MRSKDSTVGRLLGDDFEQLEKLALMAKKNPATFNYVQREIGRIIEKYPMNRRAQLREALRKDLGR